MYFYCYFGSVFYFAFSLISCADADNLQEPPKT